MVEEAAERLFGFPGESGLGESVIHQGDPSIAGLAVNGETGVAHAQSRMTTLLDVGGRAAEAKYQELAEAGFSAGEIGRGVHGAENAVGGDLAIKGVDKAVETIFADGLIDPILWQRKGHLSIID